MSVEYDIVPVKPKYDIEDEIEKLLKNIGKTLPNFHNAFLCRDGDFYVDPEVPHHDDEVRELGHLVDMNFTENQDVTVDDIHEFMKRSGIIRGHRFDQVPQYDFDIVFPPTKDQIDTIISLATTNPEVDIGFTIGFTDATKTAGRGLKNLLETLKTKFATQPSLQASIEIQEYKQGEGLFIRSFFSDASFNVNNWGVTQEALNRDIATGVERNYKGKDGVMRTAPMIDTPDDSHPPDDVEDMVSEQEPFRKGDFVRTGIDPATKRAYVDAIIRDPATIERIKNGDLKYVSPSIKALKATQTNDGRIVATKFRINHLAFVKNPAYGKMKAQIKGTCMGTADQCLPVLSNIQASTKVELMSCGGVDIHIPAKSVPQELRDLIKQGSSFTMKMVSDTMEPPAPCKKCGQPLIIHNANADHQYEAESQLDIGIKVEMEHTDDPNIAKIIAEKHLQENPEYYQKIKGLKKDILLIPGNTQAEDSTEQVNIDETYGADYATTQRGKVRFEIGSPQDRYLHMKKLPHSHVHFRDGKKEIKRYDASDFEAELQADDCVSKWIPELKSAHPEWEQDQVLAVAYAKCRKGENASTIKRPEEQKLEKLEGEGEDPLPCVECKKIFSSEKELDEHLKSHSIKPLKGENEVNKDMSYEETKKKEEQEKRDKEMQQQAEDMKKIRSESETLKAEVATLKSILDAEVKSPIVNKIVQARIKAGTLKQADSNKVSDELMTHDIQYLKSLEADYSAMIKLADKSANSSPGVSTPRYNLAADVQDSDKTTAKNVAEQIRRRIS